MRPSDARARGPDHEHVGSGSRAGGRRLSRWLRSPAAGAVVGAAAVAACTALIYPLAHIAAVDSLGVVYLLAVLLVSVSWSFWLGLLTAVASAASFDFFHIPPGGFAIAGTRNVGALVVFLIAALIAVVVAALSERVRTEAALRRREAESRTRVLAAADEERRRVVRDLHDGAQQRLVHTVITLKLAYRALERGDQPVAPLLEEALEHAQQATAELRELAHGILPSVLTRGGLRAGVDALVSRTSLPVDVDMPDERFDPAVEATAYFVIAEALTNVVKHARATGAQVRVRRDDGILAVTVRDDGAGGAALDGSSGLIGLDDRVRSLRGRLRVDSRPGRGTSIEALLPVTGDS
jgi:signal transduction histidine kinase